MIVRGLAKYKMADERHKQGTYVEGVGNEVLLGLGASILVIVIPSIIVAIVKRRSGLEIHPDEAENVEATRERLGVGAGENNYQNSDRTEPRTPPRTINAGEPCPICLVQQRFSVVTNCGHGYCGTCITTYWRTRYTFRAMNCPVCRQQISMLFMSFAEDDATEETTTVRNSVHQYNRRFSSEPRTLMEYIRDLPTLLQQLFYEFFSAGGLVFVLRFRIILCFVAAILYLVCPFDILSEAAFGILGFIDDIAIILLLLFYVSEIYRNVITDRAATALIE